MQQNNAYHKKNKKQIAISFVAIFFVIVLGLAISNYLVKSKKKLQRKTTTEAVFNVDVIKGKRVDKHYMIEGFGRFFPYKSISISPEVSGRIVKVNKEFIEGGFIRKGEVIAEIDNRDYILNLKILHRELSILKEELKIELAKQKSAIEELNTSSNILKLDDNSTIYILKRFPYVKKLKDKIEIAKSKIKLAELELERTKIKAPFDLYITTKYCDYGTYVQKGQKIAECISTEKLYIKGNIDKSQLFYIDGLNHVSVKFKLYNRDFIGRFYKLDKVLDNNSLLANVIVEIDEFPKYAFINDYIKFYVIGKELKGIIQIPESVYRENGQVWLVKNGKIHIKYIDVVYKDNKYIYTYDLKEDDLIVITNLHGVTEGTKVKVIDIVEADHG